MPNEGFTTQDFDSVTLSWKQMRSRPVQILQPPRNPRCNPPGTCRNYQAIMALTSLPTEIISMILKAVGPAQFHARVDRLTVCRTWYITAMPIFLNDITVDFTSLKRFLPTSPDVLQLLRANIRTSLVDLRGHKGLECILGTHVSDIQA